LPRAGERRRGFARHCWQCSAGPAWVKRQPGRRRWGLERRGGLELSLHPWNERSCLGAEACLGLDDGCGAGRSRRRRGRGTAGRRADHRKHPRLRAKRVRQCRHQDLLTALQGEVPLLEDLVLSLEGIKGSTESATPGVGLPQPVPSVAAEHALVFEVAGPLAAAALAVVEADAHLTASRT